MCVRNLQSILYFFLIATIIMVTLFVRNFASHVIQIINQYNTARKWPKDRTSMICILRVLVSLLLYLLSFLLRIFFICLAFAPHILITEYQNKQGQKAIHRRVNDIKYLHVTVLRNILNAVIRFFAHNLYVDQVNNVLLLSSLFYFYLLLILYICLVFAPHILKTLKSI